MYWTNSYWCAECTCANGSLWHLIFLILVVTEATPPHKGVWKTCFFYFMENTLKIFIFLFFMFSFFSCSSKFRDIPQYGTFFKSPPPNVAFLAYFFFPGFAFLVHYFWFFIFFFFCTISVLILSILCFYTLYVIYVVY